MLSVHGSDSLLQYGLSTAVVVKLPQNAPVIYGRIPIPNCAWFFDSRKRKSDSVGDVQHCRAGYGTFGGYRSGPNQITDRTFTGQRENMALGLYYYNARYYAPSLGRFLSADTLVPDPQNPQSLNRYAYALNSPLNYSDPTGHRPSDGCEYEGCTLPDFMNPNQTWRDTNGTYLPYDPAISEQFPGDFTLEEAAFGVTGLVGVAAIPITAEYVAGQVIWPTLAKTGTAIVSWLCLRDGDCTNEVQSIDPNKLNHIFGKVEHNLDQFLQSYGGDQEAA